MKKFLILLFAIVTFTNYSFAETYVFDSFDRKNNMEKYIDIDSIKIDGDMLEVTTKVISLNNPVYAICLLKYNMKSMKLCSKNFEIFRNGVVVDEFNDDKPINIDKYFLPVQYFKLKYDSYNTINNLKRLNNTLGIIIAILLLLSISYILKLKKCIKSMEVKATEEETKQLSEG